MIAVDTNILIHAHRAESNQHGAALRWIRHLTEGSSRWALPVFCLAEFARVVTHRKVFARPSTPEEVAGWLGALCSSPSLLVLNPGPSFPRIFLSTAKEADARGNLMFDAQIAAVCQEHGVERLLTLDRDFSRFPRLKIVNFERGPRD